MSLNVRFAKDRQKFAAAHFTVFPDGNVERLHGHNYVVAVGLVGDTLDMGLIFPFHLIKPEIQKFCDHWDERVLLPKQCKWLTISEAGDQLDLHLKTPRVNKHYSFPREDVVLLDIDNISCENLAKLFWRNLAQSILPLDLSLKQLEVTISESAGQSVTVTKNL